MGAIIMIIVFAKILEGLGAAFEGESKTHYDR